MANVRESASDQGPYAPQVVPATPLLPRPPPLARTPRARLNTVTTSLYYSEAVVNPVYGNGSAISQFSSPEITDSLSGSSSTSLVQRKILRSAKIRAPLTWDLEKAALTGSRHHHYAEQNPLRDPEKHQYQSSQRSYSPYVSHGISHSEHAHLDYTRNNNTEELEDENVESKTFQILIYLSTLSPLISLLFFLWTVLVLIILLILSPLRICTTRAPFTSQLTDSLSRSLLLQLQLIHSPVNYATITPYDPAMLTLIHLVSPIVSFGVAMAAWVAAIFWFYAAILGDPDGRGGKDDGRATVVAVRDWWGGWLESAFR
ncbi:MAG: hypothetical protein M1827_005032 [Pycnora praestabilis]|nr:MAG: hypothetical protein M1827_005032 [Pycnora praestabilis]